MARKSNITEIDKNFKNKMKKNVRQKENLFRNAQPLRDGISQWGRLKLRAF